MRDEIAGALCAGVCCLGSWGAIALGAGWLAHRRARNVERALGREALPPDELPLLFYAGASVVWVSALVLAVVGLVKRDWARLGRNCLYLFLGHMTLVTLAAMTQATLDSVNGRTGDPMGVVLLACVIVAGSAIASLVFFWRWAGARADRIAATADPSAEPPGAERFAVYAGSLLFWPVGLIAAVVYRAPESVRVGMNALRLTALHVVMIALAVCAALPVIVSLLER